MADGFSVRGGFGTNTGGNVNFSGLSPSQLSAAQDALQGLINSGNGSVDINGTSGKTNVENVTGPGSVNTTGYQAVVLDGTGNSDVQGSNSSRGQLFVADGGNDTFHTTSGNNTIYTGWGSDKIDISGGASDTVYADPVGAATVELRGGSLTASNVTADFTSGHNTATLSGTDTINFSAGSTNTISLAGGNEHINESQGSSSQGGSEGTPVFGTTFNVGDNNVVSGDGNAAFNITGSNNLFELTGNDSLNFTGAGSDTVNISGNSTISAGSGTSLNVSLEGGNNVFQANGTANATVYGGTGNDTLYGGDGNNHFVAGSGSTDFEIGGSGSTNVFEFDKATVEAGAPQHYVIEANGQSNYALDLVGYASGNQNFSALSGNTESTTGGVTTISLDNGATTITIEGSSQAAALNAIHWI